MFAGTPLQDHDLLQEVEMLVLQTGQLAQEYKDCCALPDAAKLWTHTQDWRQQAFNLKEEPNVTASYLYFGANTVETHDEKDTFDRSLSHFDEALAANLTVISQFSKANNTMHKTIQGNIENLTNQLETMNNAQQHLALNEN